MAQNNQTSVSYWLSLPLVDLTAWIRESNAIIKEQNDQRKQR